MHRIITSLFQRGLPAALGLAVLCVDQSVLAGTGSAPQPAPEAAISTQQLPSEWEISLEPYGWLAGVQGNTAIAGVRPIHFDVPFKSILNHLDMVAAMQAEVHHGRWSLLLDGMYLKLSDGVDPQGKLLTSINAQLDQVLAEAAVAYRLWEGKRGYIDILAGARYMEMGLKLNFEVSSSGVREVSEQLSKQIIDTATSRAQAAVQAKVDAVQSQLEGVRQAVAGRIAKAQSDLATVDTQALVDQVKGTAKEAAVSQIVQSDGFQQIVDTIAGLTPIEKAKLIDTIKSNADLIKAQAELVKAAVQAQAAAKAQGASGSLNTRVAATTAKAAAIRAQASQRVDAALNDAVKSAQRAAAKAQKELNSAIEKAIRAAIPEELSATRGWVDPFVGFRGRYDFTDHLFTALRADIGGFGVSSKLAWQAYGTLGWQFNRHWASELGYRYLAVDYNRSGFLYDTHTSGAFLGLKYTF